MTERERWEKTWLVAELWWCGDDICDCHQPRIYRRTPNRDFGFPANRCEPLWDGTFVSEPTPEQLEACRQELRDAAARFKIPLDEDLFGRREE